LVRIQEGNNSNKQGVLNNNLFVQDGAAVLEKWQKIRANPREMAQKAAGIAWPARPADTSTDMSGK
jgi:hypothetical protein